MKPFLILILSLSFIISATAQGKTENRNLVFDSSDLKIIREDYAILSDSSKWNRQDIRQCTYNIATGACRLFYKASVDVTTSPQTTFTELKQALKESQDIVAKQLHSRGK